MLGGPPLGRGRGRGRGGGQGGEVRGARRATAHGDTTTSSTAAGAVTQAGLGRRARRANVGYNAASCYRRREGRVNREVSHRGCGRLYYLLGVKGVSPIQLIWSKLQDSEKSLLRTTFLLILYLINVCQVKAVVSISGLRGRLNGLNRFF